MEAVALGISRRKLATTALLEVKRALEAQRDYPVMVAVDEFSEWCVLFAYGWVCVGVRPCGWLGAFAAFTKPTLDGLDLCHTLTLQHPHVPHQSHTPTPAPAPAPASAPYRFHPSTYHFALKKVEGSRLVLVRALRDLVPVDGPVRACLFYFLVACVPVVFPGILDRSRAYLHLIGG